MATGGTLTARAPVVAAIDPAQSAALRKHCDDRAKSMMAGRRDIDPVVAEIASLAQPAVSRFTPSTSRRPRRSIVNRLYDGYGITASGILTNGMTSGLSSSSRVWFKLKVPDTDLMKFYAVKVWLSTVERVMQDFMAQTNYYGALKAGYGELGLFGTEACFMAEHWQRGMVCYPMTFGEYWTSNSDANEPDSLLRQVPMTTRQLVQKFVASRWDKRDLDWSRVSLPVRNAWDASNYETVFDVMQLVEPNPAWDPARFDAKGKAFRSVYWEAKCDAPKTYLAADGMEEQPFWCARWGTSTADDVYGWGPGWNALADLRGLQAQAKRKGDATDYVVKPPMIGPAGLRLRMQPGSYTPSSNLEKGAVQPAWSVDPRAIEIISKDVNLAYRSIDEFFYVDLFKAITDMEGVQPRNEQEIFARNEEKLSQLGPVIDRVNTEKLGMSIDRVFGICMRRGLFPPPPPEMGGMDLQVDYISVLAQAQRAVGLTGVERSLGFVGNLSAKFTDVGDNVDTDFVVVDYLERSGFPAAGIRDPKARDAIRAERQKVAMAEQAQKSMPAMEQGAKAAEVLSRTDMRGQPLLDQVLGGGMNG